MSGFGDLGGDDQDYDDMFSKVQERRTGHVYLFYGGQGTGKTYTAMQADEPVFVIDTELRADITANEYPDRDIRVFEPGEISFENVDPDEPLEDAIDIPSSLDSINNSVIQLVQGYKTGELEGGTVVIDSVTDLWSWCQEWGKQRLMEENQVNEATFRLENQFDWGMITNKHTKIFNGLRTLSKKHGVDVIATAREKERPDYADSGSEHYVKCQNEVPFFAEVSARFTKETRKGQVRHVMKFDKLLANNQPAGELVDPTWEDIQEAVETGEIPDQDDEDGDSGGF